MGDKCQDSDRKVDGKKVNTCLSGERHKKGNQRTNLPGDKSDDSKRHCPHLGRKDLTIKQEQKRKGNSS